MHLPGRTIAVIDDDPRVLEALASLLSSCGYEVRQYISAEQFLQAGGPGQSGCIVADIQMRQMSGLGLLEHLRGSGCDVPMILITGNPSARSEAFYRESGATAFFRKPVDGDALVEAIRSVWSILDPE